MGRFKDFLEGLWLNDQNAEPGKSKIYPPVKKQTKIPKAPAPKKIRIPPPIQVNPDDK